MLHISLLWESDINVEKLSKVAKDDAIEGSGRAAKKELLGTKQLGDGLQVLEGHLPDLRFCVPADSLQVRSETVYALAIKHYSPDFGHSWLKPPPVGHCSWQVVVFTKL